MRFVSILPRLQPNRRLEKFRKCIGLHQVPDILLGSQKGSFVECRGSHLLSECILKVSVNVDLIWGPGFDEFGPDLGTSDQFFYIAEMSKVFGFEPEGQV